jgi:hypothetical protein
MGGPQVQRLQQFSRTNLASTSYALESPIIMHLYPLFLHSPIVPTLSLRSFPNVITLSSTRNLDAQPRRSPEESQ